MLLEKLKAYIKFFKNFFLTCFVIVSIAFGSTSLSNYIMSNDLDYKIANLVMVGFKGTGIDSTSTIYDAIKNKNLGGVILYEKDAHKDDVNIINNKQVTKLCSDIKKLNRKILIAVDEEGGYVSRLNQNRGYDKTSSAREIANLRSYNKTRMWSKIISDKLSKANINFNLAPVVDLDINETSEALGKQERMFSKDPGEVSIQASIFISEHRKKNIITSLKHFPGYGSASVDPHKDITDVTDTWKESELLPYKILIRSNLVDTIMTAHIMNEKLDKDYPATLSKKIINGILRNKLKYNGVVISDDLLMGAIVKKYSFENAIVLALNAGVDILLFSKEYYEDKPVLDEVIRIVRENIKNGNIKRQTIDEAYIRVKNLKSKFIN